MSPPNETAGGGAAGREGANNSSGHAHRTDRPELLQADGATEFSVEREGGGADDADEAAHREDADLAAIRDYFAASEAVAAARTLFADAIARGESDDAQEAILGPAWAARLALIARDDYAAERFMRDVVRHFDDQAAARLGTLHPSLARPEAHAIRGEVVARVEEEVAARFEATAAELAARAAALDEFEAKADEHMAAHIAEYEDQIIDERVAEGVLRRVRKTPPEPAIPRVHAWSDLTREQGRPREWVLPNWLPVGAATVLAGHGGGGKSLLMARLAVCVSRTTERFLGLPIDSGGHVVVYTAEDDAAEWRRRITEAAAKQGVPAEDLPITVIDVSDTDAVLYGRVNGGQLGPTGRYHQLMDVAVENKARLVIVDNASDAFGGNEIARAEVRAFLAALRRIGVKCNGAVLALLHVNRATASAGGRTSEFYSGSTAWNNSARARIAFYTPRQDEDEGGDGAAPADDGTRVIELAKSNYAEFGAVGQTVALRLARDGYSVDSEDTPTVGSIRAGNDEREALTFLAEEEAAGRPAYAAATTDESAASRMAASPDCPQRWTGRAGKRRFRALIQRMAGQGLIAKTEWRTPSRHYVAVWTVTDAGRAQLRGV